MQYYTGRDRAGDGDRGGRTGPTGNAQVRHHCTGRGHRSGGQACRRAGGGGQGGTGRRGADTRCRGRSAPGGPGRDHAGGCRGTTCHAGCRGCAGCSRSTTGCACSGRGSPGSGYTCRRGACCNTARRPGRGTGCSGRGGRAGRRRRPRDTRAAGHTYRGARRAKTTGRGSTRREHRGQLGQRRRLQCGRYGYRHQNEQAARITLGLQRGGATHAPPHVGDHRGSPRFRQFTIGEGGQFTLRFATGRGGRGDGGAQRNLGVLVAKSAAGTEQQGFDPPRRRAQFLRQLGIAQSAKFAHRQRGPMGRGEAIQCHPHRELFFGDQPHIFRRRPAGRLRGGLEDVVTVVGLRHAAAASQHGERDIRGDAGHPCAKSLRLAQGRQGAQSLQERVLGNILRLGAIADQMERQCANARRMAVEQCPVGIDVIMQGAHNQFSVDRAAGLILFEG